MYKVIKIIDYIVVESIRSLEPKLWRCVIVQVEHPHITLQATLNKLLTYCALMSTQPPALSGMGNKK